ncbi:zinc finger c-x8-C-x5-C-x3-H type (and similar) domain-containing protein [Ditylenchus destructor]|uniref:Zinc finger c-x8-C-x5-C-x3-H type (And similar) domain-containing protein n=1 Tax=Ditylenchus destructor TaxID=166010 RepID=A0AAD4MMU2_9BILA|nr:zinc finger c-x8-C-x5-C-x3-H type (and similar) domain-containing protein [Ditylenchus destructor]
MANQPVIDISLYINPAKTKEVKRKNGALSRFEQTFKTVMCQSWLETLTCRFGERCKFAHGVSELRHVDRLPSLASNPKYKTRLCVKYINKGICPYGHRCLFIHPNSASGNTDASKNSDHISSPESETSPEYNLRGISSLGQSNFNLYSCFSKSDGWRTNEKISPSESDKSQEYNIWDTPIFGQSSLDVFACFNRSAERHRQL